MHYITMVAISLARVSAWIWASRSSFIWNAGHAGDTGQQAPWPKGDAKPWRTGKGANQGVVSGSDTPRVGTAAKTSAA